MSADIIPFNRIPAPDDQDYSCDGCPAAEACQGIPDGDQFASDEDYRAAMAQWEAGVFAAARSRGLWRPPCRATGPGGVD